MSTTNPTEQAAAEAAEQASTDLSLALSLLDIMQQRWDDFPEQLNNLFGGVRHADSSALVAIERLVQQAKERLDAVPVAGDLASANGEAS